MCAVLVCVGVCVRVGFVFCVCVGVCVGVLVLCGVCVGVFVCDGVVGVRVFVFCVGVLFV